MRPHAHGVAREPHDVVGAVADERRDAIGQRRRDELAPLAVGHGVGAVRIDALDEHGVLPEVQAVVRGAFERGGDVADAGVLEQLDAPLLGERARARGPSGSPANTTPLYDANTSAGSKPRRSHTSRTALMSTDPKL